MNVSNLCRSSGIMVFFCSFQSTKSLCSAAAWNSLLLAIQYTFTWRE